MNVHFAAWRVVAIVALAALVFSCSSSKNTTTAKKTTYKTSTPSKSSSTSSSTSAAKVSKGQASYYADKFEGRATANGEKYRKSQLTAAHRTLPFGTIVRVTNLANGKTVDVRVNDRGPFKEGRIIDVSRAAAEKLDMIKAGVINVSVTVIKEP